MEKSFWDKNWREVLLQLSNREGIILIFQGCSGDYEPGLAKPFAIVFGCPYWGCNAHFSGKVRKHGPKIVSMEHAMWEKQLRTLPCLPANEIYEKVMFYVFSFVFILCLISR